MCECGCACNALFALSLWSRGQQRLHTQRKGHQEAMDFTNRASDEDYQPKEDRLSENYYLDNLQGPSFAGR